MDEDKLRHPRTVKQVKVFIRNPSHSLILSGAKGSGKKTLAEEILAAVLDIDKEKIIYYPYFYKLFAPPGKQISIDEIRQIKKALSLVPPGTKKIRQVILIENATALTIEAQNSLLKIFEEPPLHSLFILTISSNKNILPTVLSRAQEIKVQPVPKDQAVDFYNKYGIGRQSVEQAWELSQGLPGLLTALLAKSRGSHPLRQSVEEAKIFLKMDKYKRLLFLDKKIKTFDEWQTFLDALSRILAALSSSAARADKEALLSKILNSRKLVAKIAEALEYNVSPKVLTLTLVANLEV